MINAGGSSSQCCKKGQTCPSNWSALWNDKTIVDGSEEEIAKFGKKVIALRKIYGGNNYYIINEDDNYLGKTYWIFKNSKGPDYGHAGYAYFYFANLDNMITPYYAKTPIYSMTLTDEDIICQDADGDGYYYWGIGQKPANCQEVPSVLCTEAGLP